VVVGELGRNGRPMVDPADGVWWGGVQDWQPG